MKQALLSLLSKPLGVCEQLAGECTAEVVE
jgi:hypothetical protein